MNQHRVIWIDYAKAIGIYSVVLGHALSYSIVSEATARNFIYIFHMPLFFFISGYLFKPNKETSFKTHFTKDVLSLFIPYISLNVLAFILLLPLLFFIHIDIGNKIFQFLTGQGHAPAGPAWFLLCLFGVRIIAFWVLKQKIQIILSFVLFSCIIAYFLPFHLYWCIDVVFMAFPIFAIGHLSKRVATLEITLSKKSMTYKYAVFIISLTLTVAITSLQGSVSMYSRAFGQTPALFYPGAFVGILMIVSFCSLFKNDKMLVRNLSSGTIVIMGLHGILYIYVNHLALAVLPVNFTDGYSVLYKSIICLIVTILFYYPIRFFQNHVPFLIGYRGKTITNPNDDIILNKTGKHS